MFHNPNPRSSNRVILAFRQLDEAAKYFLRQLAALDLATEEIFPPKELIVQVGHQVGVIVEILKQSYAYQAAIENHKEVRAKAQEEAEREKEIPF